MSEEFRIEHDTMGEVKVPAKALYRAQTQRAVENFPISGKVLTSHHISALGQVKRAAALANAELGVISDEIAQAIVAAADQVIAGEHDGEFPIDVFQTGSGTSSNMNTNEVISTLGSRSGVEIHPNDHVNASQSSNDVFPSSIHIAATEAAVRVVIPKLTILAESLERKAEEFKDVVKAGRTHLMDATPIMLGQEFSGYAQQIRNGIARVEATIPHLAELPLGGTAVGTGINTPAGFSARVIELIAEPLIETLHIRNVFHDLHSYGRAQKLRLRLLLCFDLDDPVSLAAFVGQQTKLRHVSDDRSHQVDDARIPVAPCAEHGIRVNDGG